MITLYGDHVIKLDSGPRIFDEEWEAELNSPNIAMLPPILDVPLIINLQHNPNTSSQISRDIELLFTF